MKSAEAILTAELTARTPEARALFLREMLAHTAAGLVITESATAAAEACYRIGDAVVSREAGGPK